MFADPQVQRLHMVDEIDSPHYRPLRLVAQPIRLSRTDSDLRLRPPECGEHTDEILRSIGYAQEEIADLRTRKVV